MNLQFIARLLLPSWKFFDRVNGRLILEWQMVEQKNSQRRNETEKSGSDSFETQWSEWKEYAGHPPQFFGQCHNPFFNFDENLRLKILSDFERALTSGNNVELERVFLVAARVISHSNEIGTSFRLRVSEVSIKGRGESCASVLAISPTLEAE